VARLAISLLQVEPHAFGDVARVPRLRRIVWGHLLDGFGQTVWGADVYKIDLGLPKEPIIVLQRVFDGGVLINGEDMLDTSKFPDITFKSTNVQQKDADKFVVAGDLTLRGITHKVQVPLTFNGAVTTRMGVAAGFSGYLTLKLSDFGVPFTREFEPGRRVVGDELKVELQIEAKPRQ